MTGAAAPRTVFATPRESEFFEIRSLQTQTGQPSRRFADVLVKELLDNALDAAEAVGTAPEITLTTGCDGELLTITVADSGPGIPPGVVRQVLDFSVLVSDKAAYITVAVFRCAIALPLSVM